MDITPQPLHDRVLVRRKSADENIGSIIVPESAKKEREPVMRGTVLAVGKGAYTKKGIQTPCSVAVDDEILFSGHQGQDIEIAGERLILTREPHILAIISKN